MMLTGFAAAGLLAVFVGLVSYTAVRLDVATVCRSPAPAAELLLCGLLDVGVCAVLLTVLPAPGVS
jgi:hypothetical protein